MAGLSADAATLAHYIAPALPAETSRSTSRGAADENVVPLEQRLVALADMVCVGRSANDGGDES